MAKQILNLSGWTFRALNGHPVPYTVTLQATKRGSDWLTVDCGTALRLLRSAVGGWLVAQGVDGRGIGRPEEPAYLRKTAGSPDLAQYPHLAQYLTPEITVA